MKVGVLALQGDVREHVSSLIACGVEPISVRRSSEIDAIDALVLPGGESTTIAQLAEVFGIFDLIKNKINSGMPVYGSCAGMILLAEQILDAEAIWAVFYKTKPFNLKSLNAITNYPGPKYKKVSFSNPGHAINLSKKLNSLFNCDDFTVVMLTSGEIVTDE